MRRTFSAIVAFWFLAANLCSAQTARAYYEELYKAGGLDRMADLYACFDEDAANENFFIFGKSDILKEFLNENGGLSKLPKSAQAQLRRGFLNVRGYSKGIPFAEEENYYKDGDSWATDNFLFDKATPGRARLTIVWETLRYKRSIEILNKDGSLRKDLTRYGRCERIPPDVRQTAQ